MANAGKVSIGQERKRKERGKERNKRRKGGGALPQVRETNFGEGVFGTLN